MNTNMLDEKEKKKNLGKIQENFVICTKNLSKIIKIHMAVALDFMNLINHITRNSCHLTVC